MKIDWKRKLASRKLWAAVIGVATGIALAFGVDAGVVSAVSGAVLSAVSIATYIITEGRVDAANVSSAATDIINAARALAQLGKEEGADADTDQLSD